MNATDLENALRDMERRADRQDGLAESLVREHGRVRGRLGATRDFLALAPKAGARLDELSRELFGETIEDIEANLTHAIREILDQDRLVRGVKEIKSGKLSVFFEVVHQGESEDILTGQGGSVCNIVSTGLRLIALSQLDQRRHRPFLVLDEQDCWLRPSLVPRFIKLIKKIAARLDLQILVISHHPVDLFALHVQKVYALRPGRDGVSLEVVRDAPGPQTDEAAPPQINE
ncbi:MAG: ATP-binding protein [Desulfovibrionaceae bacterium]|nr:ATP-binding protein [Desulfovibrionaceae bacterium]MBF0515061.1 ATP-binding protein [Desulfovibrionaceae bacterium]